VGNPELAAEINNQADLNIDFSTGITLVSINVFATVLQNYISAVYDSTLTPRLPSSPGVRKFENFGSAFKTGFELDWEQEILGFLRQQVSMAFTYAIDRERDEPLPEIAPFDLRYILKGFFLKDRLQPELRFRKVLSQNRVSKAFAESSTPGFNLLDLELSWNYNARLMFSAGIDNIFDVHYYEHLTRPLVGGINPLYAPGRNVFFTMALDLNQK
jgi:iron complex outermembrane receptor protein